MRGVLPSEGHIQSISGIDLVEGKDDEWYILEDNLRIPSGASYPLIAREIERRVSPETFRRVPVMDNRDYARILRDTMEYVNMGGIRVIMTPGRYNAAYFEHSYLAEKTGSVLAMCTDLYVEDNQLYFCGYTGSRQKVGVIYRRISDEYLDPMTFNPESLIGVPGIMDVYRSGNVAIVNAPTYLPFYENDRKYVLENIYNLVIKDVAEAGGYGVIFGNELTNSQLEDLKELIIHENRRFIAQEVIDFKDLDIVEDGKRIPRKADLRAFVLSGKTTKVWASGLTRFSRNPDSFVVNSSQGGGFKDTWVLSR